MHPLILAITNMRDRLFYLALSYFLFLWPLASPLIEGPLSVDHIRGFNPDYITRLSLQVLICNLQCDVILYRVALPKWWHVSLRYVIFGTLKMTYTFHVSFVLPHHAEFNATMSLLDPIIFYHVASSTKEKRARLPLVLRWFPLLDVFVPFPVIFTLGLNPNTFNRNWHIRRVSFVLASIMMHCSYIVMIANMPCRWNIRYLQSPICEIIGTSDFTHCLTYQFTLPIK